MNYFYKNLKYIREHKKKMSMNKFSELLGYNVSTISRWENQSNGVTIDSAIDISEKLNIPLQILLGKDIEKDDSDYMNAERIDIQTAKDEIESILKNSDMSEQQKMMVMTPLNYISSEDEKK